MERARRRRAAVAGLKQPDGVEFVDGGGYAVTSAGDVARHDDIVTFTVALSAPDGEVAWAARAFLVLGDDGRFQEDYQLTVKALAA